VEVSYNLGYTALGKAFEIAGNKWEAIPEDYEFAKMFLRVGIRLIIGGKIKIHRRDVREGGLEGVLEGMEEMKQGKVSGKKLVYKLKG